MSSEEFCVVCGRTGRPVTEGVCAECAADRAALVRAPQRAEVTICPQCGARFVAGKWVRSGSPAVPTAEDLAPFLTIHPEVGVRTIGWEEIEGGTTVREMVGHARVVFRDIERTVDVPLSVRMVAKTCTECGRRSGHYFTAVLQLRGEGGPRIKRAKELKDRLADRWEAILRESRPDWRRAVSWIEELPEGWDVFFADTLAARAVSRLAKQRFGVKIQESATLFGRKNGQDVYRVTFCLRFAGLLPPERPAVPVVADDALFEP